jgi:hypothetical protein
MKSYIRFIKKLLLISGLLVVVPTQLTWQLQKLNKNEAGYVLAGVLITTCCFAACDIFLKKLNDFRKKQRLEKQKKAAKKNY